MLWRWLPIPHALTQRIPHLRERLEANPPASNNDASLLWAAVAIILAPDPDSILLIRRAERTGDPWGGHMAFPGGRQEPGDGDLLATAIRETAEEVGTRLDPDCLLGNLEDVVPRIPVLPPIAVRPFVFFARIRPAMALNSEVAAASWITLDHLLKPETHHSVRLDIAGQSLVVQAYELDSGIVWGMTERMLTNLLSYLS